MTEEVKKELEEMGSLLAGQKVTQPYGVQQDYFVQMPDKLTARIQDGVEGETLPLVGNPYAIPSGYFEQLPQQVLAKAVQPVKRGAITFRQLRVAAAAVVLLAVGLGTFVRTGEKQQAQQDGMLANVADNDIKAYLGYAGAPIADAGAGRYLDDIDIKSEDIETYLDETGWETEMSF